LDKDKVEFFKSNEIGKGLPFGITNFERLIASDDIFKPSLRDFHVLFFVKKGSGTYFVDFKEYSFDSNTVIILSKDQLHYFNRFDLNEVELVSISFKPEFIYRNESDLHHLFQFVSTAHDKGQQILSIPGFAESQIEKMLSEMETIYTSWDSLYLSKAFYHWLCLLLIQVEMMQETQKDAAGYIIDEHKKNSLLLTQLIEQHYRSEFKLEFYAEKLGIPLKSLSKLSHDFFKKAPKALISERRILEIKRQLRGTVKSAKAIAYELNFDEPTNMFKFFRKHVGLSPNQFRETQE
jgi:AraC family transcriptional activator of pobA